MTEKYCTYDRWLTHRI